MFRRGFAVLIIFFLLSSVSVPRISGTETSTYTDASREVQFQIKVVMVGLDSSIIDESYLDWNNPMYKYQSVLIPGISTNVLYTFEYNYEYFDPALTTSFVDYLSAIGVKEQRKNLMWNTTYHYQETGLNLNYTQFQIESLSTFYDADEVETWFYDNRESYGGLPENGYTLIISYLPSLPTFTNEQYEALINGKQATATPHYYNKTMMDIDLGLKLKARWMTGWGGRHRLYFIDLSAGPSMVDQQLPLHLAAHVNNIDLSTDYGKMWLNQYVADYIYGAVYNLFAPDLVYPLNMADKYRVDVLILDNRSQGSEPSLENTLDAEKVKEELQEVLPFAEVEVEARFRKLQDYPELADIVKNSTIKGRGTSVGYPPDIYYPPNIVDLRPLYEWLTESGGGHLKDLFEVKRDEKQFDIPILVFAFERDFNLGISNKDWLANSGGVFDLWGIALYDMVLISHSEYDLTLGNYVKYGPKQEGKGLGFTHSVIHEAGHIIGLNHPFLYDPTEGYVASVMAYYPYVYEFNQFDQDTILRSLTDKVIMETKSRVAEESASNPFLGLTYVEVSRLLDQADSLYEEMEYEEALEKAVAASSKSLVSPIPFMRMPAFFLALYAFLVGGGVGFSIAYYAYARRKHKVRYCLDCGEGLHQEHGRWYCSKCGGYKEAD